ncbi:multinuclear nonheme iron-dependent oxidase [Streptomyces sp. SYSU K217416]
MELTTRLGIGIGWRPEIADAVERLSGVDWVEAVAENLCPGHLPESLLRLRERGTRVVPHGVSLGLGGAERPDPGRLADLAARAEALGSPLVSEHIAFVRAGGPLTASPRLEAGHLLPVPRTRDALAVLCENVRIAQDSLPVPLAVENIAALISWPDEEMTEGQFLAELVERTGVRLLIDVANLHTNRVNRGEDPSVALDELPVEAIAYVHVAGGVERKGVWHDTHAHPVSQPVLDILADLRRRTDPPGVLLERDDDFPPEAELASELTTIRKTLTRGAAGPLAPGGKRVERDDVGEAARGGGVPQSEDAGASARRGRTPVPALRATDDRSGLRSTTDTADAPGVPQSEDAAAPADRGGAVVGAAGAGLATGPSGVRTGPDAGAGRRVGRAQHADGSADRVEAARGRVALAQTALLSALVAGTPAPERFDARRLRVQSRALAAKRADVIGKVAPELPLILGDGYRRAFLAYATARPMRDGYRRDALDFAEQLLIAGLPEDPAVRRRLTAWWRERAAPQPPTRTARATRFVRAARAALVRR